jgi:hypothetical protein
MGGSVGRKVPKLEGWRKVPKLEDMSKWKVGG